MKTRPIQITGSQGQQLQARLDMPVNRHPHTFALFAHCFTCNSNFTAVREISRALNLNGIAVLRFDFTGLGHSEGEFADTNFTSNIQDLLSAAAFLEKEYQAPALLIGHSLGGAATLCAAHHLPSVQAVATIGAPYEPEHVKRLLQADLEKIETDGTAEVSIGGRPFRIKKQFLDDLRTYSTEEKINSLDKALLILHSPQDTIVNIDNAARLYHAARHPKSFISLDGADHMLSSKTDSHYAGEVISSWLKRYLQLPAREELESDREVAVRLGPRGYTTEIMVRHHHLTADEPESVGGNDFGPNPYELVSAGLGACTAMTLQMYARRKKWDLREVVVHLSHRKDYTEDMLQTGEKPTRIDLFDRRIEVEGELSGEQLERLQEIADRCPVHRTLHGDIEVRTRLLRHSGDSGKGG